MKEKENQKLIDSYDYLSNAASTHDCTGLIPSAPVSEAELESYEDVYHYRPPRMNSSPSFSILQYFTLYLQILTLFLFDIFCCTLRKTQAIRLFVWRKEQGYGL